LYRAGDYVGTTVNVASRIASMAMAGEVLMTDELARAAPRAAASVESAGVRLVRGVTEPLALFRLVGSRPGQHDPVCGATLTDAPAARLQRNGRELAFCSEDCLRRFLNDPDRFVAGTT
jgi:YHS domain-containing protein